MTPEEFKKEMEEVRDGKGCRIKGDTEVIHINADDLLCKALRELGYGAGIDVYEDEEWTKWHA